MLFLLGALLACSTPPDSADSTDTAVTTVACNTLTCTGTDLCRVQRFDPECTSLDDTAASCPEGTTQSMCGGDGHPCCCEPAPPEEYTCVDGSTCGEEPTCDCVSCPEGTECEQMTANGTFLCAVPAKP